MADSRILHRAAGKWRCFHLDDLYRFRCVIRPSHPKVVYALYQGRELVYVGRTCNVRSRLVTHLRRIGFDSFKVRVVGTEDAQKWLERRLIFRLRPSANRLIPSNLFAEFYCLHQRNRRRAA